MGSSEPNRVIDCAVMAAALLLCPEVSHADQGGGSFWFPGQFASLAAVQQTPGWALSVNYYHSSVAAAGSAAAARQILAGGIPANVNVSLNLSLIGRADLVALAPTYTLATPVLGGQLVAGIAGQYGRAAASIAGTLTAIAGPTVVTRSGVLEGSLVSYGDLAPFAELLWSHGVNNYMVYVTGNIPVGDYDPLRLPNIGSGTVRSTLEVAIPISTRRQGTHSRAWPALPTISRIQTRSTAAEAISTSIGAHRTTSPGSFSSALLATPTSKSLTIPARTRSSAASDHAFSVSARKSDITSRWETCRASWA